MFSTRLISAPEIKTQQITLIAYPPHMQKCFQLLQAAGAKYFALFGGAIRDADYAACYEQFRSIKDYDLRVWLCAQEFEAVQQAFLINLGEISDGEIHTEPCLGTNKVHYCFNYDGIEMDVSIRAIPTIYHNHPPVSAVAIDRASSSDVGLSSVAIDSSGQAWARPEYLQNQKNKTLTIYASANPDRSKAYEERMQAKFSDHKTVQVNDSTRAAISGCESRDESGRSIGRPR